MTHTPTHPPTHPTVGSLVDDLARLVRVIGPWPAAATDQADAFYARYLTDERLRRFAPAGPALAALATRFAELPPACETIPLAGLPSDERAALIALTSDLYSIMQVRFAVAGLPPPGVCVNDPAWQTWVPPT